jgi:hypothetical protein
VVQWYFSWMTVLAREYVEVHLPASHTKTEHFWLCVCVWVNHIEKLHHC